MQKINPFLWFNDNAEEAVKFYTSVFKNSKTGKALYYNENIPDQKGKVMTIEFEIEGQEFIALNGGPEFKFSQAISFFVKCNSQDEVDELWNKLSEGGEIQQCGWLIDKFGISWQIVPTMLGEMLSDKNSSRSNRVMEAMLKMKKLDLNILKEAYNQN